MRGRPGRNHAAEKASDVVLFSIQCTTCQSRLKVRDRAVIGQILACPKCQSMVLVEPPPDWEGDAAAAPDASAVPPGKGRGSMAETAAAPIRPSRTPAPAPAEAAFDEAASLLDDAPPRQAQPFTADEPAPPSKRAANPPDLAATVDAPIDTHLAEEEKPEPGQAPPRPAAPPKLPSKRAAAEDQTAEEPAEQSAEEPVLPGDEWVSAGARRWQQVALVVGGVVVGLVLAVGVFGYLVSRTAPSDTQVAVREDATSDDGETNDAVSTAGDRADDAPGDDDASEPGGAEEASPGAARPTKTDDAAPEDGGSGADPKGDDGDADPMPSGAAGEEKETPADEVVKPDSPATPKGPVNPFDLDDPTRPPAGAEAVEAEEPAESPMPLDPLDDALGEFAPFLDDAPIRPLPPLDRPKTDVDAADKPDEATVPVEPVPAAPLMPRPEPREVNVAAQLELPILEMQFNNVPLIDYLRFLSQLSAIPITIEPDAVLKANVSLSTPLVVNQQNATVGAALEDVLRKHGLAYAASDGQLHVVPPPFPDGEPGRIAYTVGDLVSSDFPIERLAAMTTSLIEPDIWEDVGGESSVQPAGDKLVVVAPPAAHFQFLVLCEKLRVARGGVKRSPYPSELFVMATRRERAAEKLARPLTINFVRPTPLVDIVGRIEKECGVRILIDWEALADQGWNPAGLATLTAEAQPLGEALTALLEPMDLTWRAASADMLQVTTKERLAARPELEFHRVAALLAEQETDALLERIRTELGPENFRASGGAGALEIDPQSRCLLVLLPQPRQVELTALLAKWRPTAP